MQKANLLERTFAAKCALPLIEGHEYSSVGQPHFLDGFLGIPVRDVLGLLKTLKEDSAAGLDQIATRVSKLALLL